MRGVFMSDINSNVKVYVITHVPCDFLQSDIFVPVATNKSLGNQLNIMSSDQGENLGNLNYLLAEFSTFYWVWKNDKTSRFIGFNHFRRYFLLNENNTSNQTGQYIPKDCGWTNDYVINTFKDYDIILPTRLNFYSATVYQQYCSCHEQRIIDALIKLINEKYPEYIDAVSYTHLTLPTTILV